MISGLGWPWVLVGWGRKDISVLARFILVLLIFWHPGDPSGAPVCPGFPRSSAPLSMAAKLTLFVHPGAPVLGAHPRKICPGVPAACITLAASFSLVLLAVPVSARSCLIVHLPSPETLVLLVVLISLRSLVIVYLLAMKSLLFWLFWQPFDPC
jgi:hypothetical protein